MILVATGLRREARLLAGSDIRTVIGGGVSEALALRLAFAPGVQAVLSAGLAGALATDLAPGDCVIATGVVDGADYIAADWAWGTALSNRLPHARRCVIAGADRILACVGEKAALRTQSGAEAVDMESHVAARFARARCIPFAAVRIISDGADRNLPEAARGGMRGDGRMDGGAVIRMLLREPGQLGPLLRTAREAETAFRALARLRGALGGRFALPG
jgi:hopanoid-associated phosphorylase